LLHAPQPLALPALPRALEELNGDVMLTEAATAAQVGVKVRIRTPWAPAARTLPATPEIVSALTLRWNSPFEAWRSASSGAATPELYVRDWNGDGYRRARLRRRPRGE